MPRYISLCAYVFTLYYTDMTFFQSMNLRIWYGAVLNELQCTTFPGNIW